MLPVLMFPLYFSLSGYPPFSEKNNKMPLKDQITGGHYTFIPAAWRDVSRTGMTLDEYANIAY